MTHDEIIKWWQDWGTLVLLLAGGAALLTLGVLLAWAKAKGKRVRPAIIWASANLALLLNAEGTYDVLVHGGLTPAFAILVFAVFEIMLLNGEAQVAERYRNTTERDDRGRVTKAGEPGPMLKVVWILAGISGVVVASDAPNVTMGLLRVSLPLLVVGMWWATLTAEGYTTRRSRFAYSPRRLAERAGWLIPDVDHDLEQLRRDRKVRRMAALVRRLDTTSGRSRRRAARRFMDESETASEAVVDELRAQVARSRGLADEFVRGGQGGQDAREHSGGHTEHVPTAGHNGHAGRVPASTAPEVPAQTARDEVPGASGDGGQNGGGQGARRRSDEDLLGQYGDQLVREWLAAGEQGLTPYRVRKVCGGDGPILAERQGKRIYEAVRARVEQHLAEAATAEAELGRG